MHLGTVTHNRPLYGRTYIKGIGDLPQCYGMAQIELHQYKCELCSKVHEVLGKAEEPFYCGKGCPGLVKV